MLQGRVVTVRTITARFSDRDVTMPKPWPSEIPHLAADVRILRAWIGAQLAHPGDLSVALAAVEAAVQQAGVARRVLGKYYYRVPPAIRPLLGQRGGAGLKELLGHFVKWERWEQEALAAAVLQGRRTNPETGWIEGVSGLTERETQAYWPHIRGWSRAMIARELTDDSKRHDRTQWVSFKTVSNLCWQAKGKVLQAFGLPASGSPDEDWPEDAV